MKNYIPHIIAFAAGALIASLVFLLINASNKEDVVYLLSEEGKSAIIRCHIDAIISYIN